MATKLFSSFLCVVTGATLATKRKRVSIPLPPSPLTEPYVYLSPSQASVIDARHPDGSKKYPLLHGLDLPGWVPQRVIAESLGFSDEGIKNALKYTGGKPFLWATEFENVHDLWKYSEPQIEVDGVIHQHSEAYYHSQKPNPWNEDEWIKKRDQVMRKAVTSKLASDLTLQELLDVTKGHPLVSIKGDMYWGFHPARGGANKLATIWMELRDK